MKTLSSLSLFFLSLFFYSDSLHAQEKQPFNPASLPIEITSKLITYHNVIQVPGVKTEELMARGKKWFNTFYKNPTDVIRQTDDIRGIISGKARFKIYYPPDKNGLRTDAGNVEYSINLGIKEGKFRYVIDSLNWKHTSYFPIERWMDDKAQTYDKAYLYFLEETDSIVRDIIKNLEIFMKSEPAKKNDDW